MKHTSWYIGVDGGGSKTQVFLMNLQQRVGITKIGKASNPNTVKWDTAMETIEQLIGSTLVAVDAGAEEVRGISVCLAGLYRKDHIEQLKKKMFSIYPNAEIEVANDALAALTAGTHGESGVVLIAGTGSVCLGETQHGQIARAGGYGSMISDEGSGYDIGRAGIMAAIQGAEFRGINTILWELTREFFHIDQIHGIIPAIYGVPNSIEMIASFAPVVMESAPYDAVADQIVLNAVNQHVRLIQSVYLQLNDKIENTIVLSGSLFTKTNQLVGLLQPQLPDLNFRVLTISAAAGAVLRAVLHEQKIRLNKQYSHSEIIHTWSQIAKKVTLIDS